MKILGIETSCDETGAAVYDTTAGLLSSTLASQATTHASFGGVVPEIASREQILAIEPIVHAALTNAQSSIFDLSAIAVTTKPGLSGSLLVGLAYAKAIAYTHTIPLIGIDHLEGHIFSACIEHTIPFPFICLTVSGGHTALYHVTNFGSYTLIGQTVDDAAGEAFDKIAQLLHLGYPGGPIIEQLAAEGHYTDYYCYPRLKKQGMNFSFSGLKTAVLYDLIRRGYYDVTTKKLLCYDHDLMVHVASSFLVTVGDILIDRLARACNLHPATSIVFVGGVACNNYLRTRIASFAQSIDFLFFTPRPQFCTDNGAMIAFVGQYKAQQGHFDSLNLDIF